MGLFGPSKKEKEEQRQREEEARRARVAAEQRHREAEERTKRENEERRRREEERTRAKSKALVTACCVEKPAAEIRELLRWPGVDVNWKDENGSFALYWACYNGNAEVVRLLLEDPRVNVNANKGGATGLVAACNQGRIEVARLLLADPRVDVNAGKGAGGTGFYHACWRDHLDVVRLLLKDARVDVNAMGDGTNTGLKWACYGGHSKVVKLLVADPRVDVNAADGDALRTASYRGYLEVVKLLLADPRVSVDSGFRGACSGGQTELVRQFLGDPRLNVNAADENGWTGFISVCSSGKADVVRLLVADQRVEINARTKDGCTGFLYACYSGKADVVQLLLTDKRVDPNAKAEKTWELPEGDAKVVLRGVTAFMMACWEGKTDVVSLLLAEPRVDTDAVDGDGNTGFILACRRKHDDLLKLLLGRPDRLDVSKRNIRGQSGADLASESVKGMIERAVSERRTKQAEKEERKRQEEAARKRAEEEARKKAEEEAPDVTKCPSEPSGGSSRSNASAHSSKSDHSAFLSKLRITKDEVSYSTDPASILGEGSFATVYRGVLRGATRVAVKTIKGEVNPGAVQMFLKEIAVWDGLNQRNVLPLLAFCESPPLLISELTDGDMRSRLDKLRWDQTVGLRYLREVATGMAYLHSFKVLHGDLKCANIMIDHDIPKIADFGLAKVRSHLSLTTTRGDRESGGSVSGTPPFMAPELWRGGKLRPPVDVYAFAMVCYEVTDEGGYPFEGLWMAAVSEAVLRGDRPERPDSADDKMWALMERMWAQNAADRPTFVEVCAEMEGW